MDRQEEENRKRSFIETKQKLVIAVAKSVDNGLSFLDKVQEANIGLCVVTERFWPNIPKSFDAYAKMYISKYIREAK